MRYALVAVVLAVLLVAGGLAVRRADAAPPPVSSGTGRFQVVNGTPAMTRNIMLLDSATGQTWIICGGDQGANWCRMNRDGIQGPPAAADGGTVP